MHEQHLLIWSDARHGANVLLSRTAPQPGDARARATPPMRVDHLPNKRMPLVPGVIPGRGMACMDFCPHHITRESSWRSGGAHGRGMDEEHTPRAGATMARAWRARAALYSAWHVSCGGRWRARARLRDGCSQVAVWRHRPASRSPRVLCLSERAWGGCVCARAVCAETVEVRRAGRATDPRTTRALSLREDRIGCR